ncbi:endosome-associated-trafficking regulator 1-like isoform X2 [Tachypleus tridentatus]|uniref:endosome-associated-trafficking regulator 1-like isoform X2 n=1 Tax=Tachypleus tridentatus TaxID=6853 RepID=UPI003FD06226
MFIELEGEIKKTVEENPFSFKTFIKKTSSHPCIKKEETHRNKNVSLDIFKLPEVLDANSLPKMSAVLHIPQEKNKTFNIVKDDIIFDAKNDFFQINSLPENLESLSPGGAKSSQGKEFTNEAFTDDGNSCLQSLSNIWGDQSKTSAMLQQKNSLTFEQKTQHFSSLCNDTPVESLYSGVDSLPSCSSTEFIEENKVMKQKLGEAQEELKSKTKKIESLERLVEQFKRKETEETITLEKMIQQVELNLEISTKRAITAESMVTKLKQELKTAQTLVKSVQEENEILQLELAELNNQDDVHLRAQDVSLQLLSAAENAEKSLKFLLEGVDNLRLISSYVANIGRLQEDAS